jgi:hypothetical protein
VKPQHFKKVRFNMSLQTSPSKLAFAAFLLLAGCGGQIGGQGQLSNGEPLSVLMDVTPAASGSTITLDIASPAGWSCRSVFENGPAGQPVPVRRTFPMTCSDGAKGTILVTWDNVQLRQHGAFKLNNGRTGSVLFDFSR